MLRGFSRNVISNITLKFHPHLVSDEAVRKDTKIIKHQTDSTISPPQARKSSVHCCSASIDSGKYSTLTHFVIQGAE